ncbi:zinc finger and BTB domain-containing protein 8A isoform X1 [Electrophorus electricus]|nr:zinc finger and BTB domain-containing protein 8A isoform X1 [Electrophorus electricus]
MHVCTVGTGEGHSCFKRLHSPRGHSEHPRQHCRFFFSSHKRVSVLRAKQEVFRKAGEKNPTKVAKEMEMVCESGTCRAYRTPREPGRQQVHRWTSAEMSANHQSCLLKQLDQQRRQELFCDCNVLVEGRLFRAHRNVLFGSSGYFRMLLSQGAKGSLEPVSASFDTFSPDTFAVILDFVYSGLLDLNSSNVIEVMSAASYLQMDDVIVYCKSFIKSSLEICAKEGDPCCAFLTDDSPLPDTQGGDQPSVADGVLWEPPDEDRVHEYPGEVTGSQAIGLACSPRAQPVLEDGADGEQNVQFTALVSEPRRRGTRRRSVNHRYVSDDTSALDLQRAQKADELYATLPTIVGVVGVFNKDSSPSMRFKCPFCTHTVKRKADLKRHLRCHTGERPYPCQACSKRFTRLEHLRSHFETIHQARKLVCRKCKRRVTEQSGQVVCEGTRRYRLCGACIQQENATMSSPTEDTGMLLGVEDDPEDNQDVTWVMDHDDDDGDDLAEDSGTDLIIQEVEDSDDEPDVKRNGV